MRTRFFDRATASTSHSGFTGLFEFVLSLSVAWRSRVGFPLLTCVQPRGKPFRVGNEYVPLWDQASRLFQGFLLTDQCRPVAAAPSPACTGRQRIAASSKRS